MDATGWAILGICIPVIVALAGAYFKAHSDALGWKTSYEREKERGDRQDRMVENSALATDIANKLSEGLHKLISEQANGGR